MSLRARVAPGLFLLWGCAPAAPIEPPVSVEASTASVPRVATSAPPRLVQLERAPAIVWMQDRERAFARGVREGRSVLVFVIATWQPRTQHLDRTLWTDDEVRRAAQGVVALRVDASDASDEALEHWLTERGLDHVPSVGLHHPEGASLGRLTGPEVAKAGVLRLLRRR